ATIVNDYAGTGHSPVHVTPESLRPLCFLAASNSRNIKSASHDKLPNQIQSQTRRLAAQVHFQLPIQLQS
ncbi:hypothetical protein ACRALDRAFT_1059148, partial [Sodiomyces alcalophilus JCM 7366]|uniref:uncharacterized protein n=1 Tax=Sodiomyces alcalophilus JCM 7366 TaxID=591952 RepID=UPI0039B5CDFC